MGQVEKLTVAIEFLDSVINILPHLDMTKVTKDSLKAYKTFPDQRAALQIALDAFKGANSDEARAEAAKVFKPELDLADEILGE